jgi:F-type H+-transporting ATPase subunit epsilon
VRLKILLPIRVLVDRDVRKIVAEGAEGSFGVLPRHIDLATTLVPGVLLFETEDGEEHVIGNDEGTLVKCGDDVLVSVRRAVRGEDLDDLRSTIQHEFLELDERERVARSALARLEAATIRRFGEIAESGP